MDTAQFVDALKSECRDSAVSGCVEDYKNPPGRRPDTKLLEISQWFNSLAVSDREMVMRAMADAADATLFGVLCVLDGVRTIECSGEKSNFHLVAEKDGVKSIISPTQVFLHDMYKGL